MPCYKPQRFCSLSCSSSRIPEADRFWAKVNKNSGVIGAKPELGECWIWTASKTPKGYGEFWLAEAKRLGAAHRWSWQQQHGSVPDGLELDHLCRVRACVRPEHLDPVTPAINNQRGMNCALRPPNEPREKCANGHEMTPENSMRRTDREREQYYCRKCTAARQLRWKKKRALARAA